MKAFPRAFVAVGLVLTLGAAAQSESGWRARVDALLLDPSINSQGFGRIFEGVPEDTEFGGSLNNGVQGGYRLVAEKENCSGFGVRARYFELANAVDYSGQWQGASNFFFNGPINVDVYAVDIEATQRAEFRYWDLVVGGGLRAGGVEISQDGSLFTGPAIFFGLPSGVDFDGVGPTVSLYAERPLGASNLSVVGRARASLLFGELDQTPTFGAGAPSPVTSDDLVQVTEIQFGLNYQRPFRGVTGSFGVFWEAQRWDSDSNALGDLGLHGLSLQTGLQY